MTREEFDGVWEKLSALWPTWAKRLDSPGLLRHVALEWWELLRGVPTDRVNRAVSLHWKDHGSKYQPDQAEIARLCDDPGVSSAVLGEDRIRAEQRYYESDLIDRMRMEADSLAYERDHSDSSTALRCEHQLKELALRSVRVARGRMASLARLWADPWPAGDPGRKLIDGLRREADRAMLVAERICRIAGVKFVRQKPPATMPEKLATLPQERFSPPNPPQIPSGTESAPKRPICPF